MRRSQRSVKLLAVLVALIGSALPLRPGPAPAVLPAPAGLIPPAVVPAPHGFWLAGAEGGVFSYGAANYFGSAGALALNKPITGMAATPSGQGYWLAASDGGIFAYGDAGFFGSTGDIKLNKPITGMATTPSGQGYWLVASDGGIFAFGDAGFFGSTGDMKLNKPITGMAATPSGQGYWLVASDGGIFAFGDATFFGSTGDIKLNKPITGMAAAISGAGYWLVASDGGVFSFGDAPFYGAGAALGARSVVAMVVSPTGRGYWQVERSGEVFAFGDADASHGADGSLARKIVAAAPVFPPGLGVPRVAEGYTLPEPVDPNGPAVPAPVPTDRARPNLLVVVMDDMRLDSSLAVMPNTQRWMIEAGTTFENGYANTPLCCPERATVFSGRAMHNHGVYLNGEGKNLDHEWTLARYLRDAGYRTALAGKFLVGWGDDIAPPHYDTFALTNGGYLDSYFNVNGKGRTVDYSTDFMREISVEFLNGFESEDERPWYLHVTPQAPHDSTDGDWYWPERHDDAVIPEYVPSPAATDTNRDDQHPYVRDKRQSLEESRKAHDGQLRTLLSADEMIDGIFRTLEANGELDNTLVIFTSDNGFSWGERGVPSKGLPYVESVKVPFLVRWPGVMPAGATDKRLVGGIDILPTLLDAARYTPPVFGHPLDGRSFLQPDGREHMLLEMHEGHRSIPDWAALQGDTWQYVEYYEKDRETITFREYYDLTNDPWQLTNLLEDGDPSNDPDIARLSADLAVARTCAGRDGPSACP